MLEGMFPEVIRAIAFEAAVEVTNEGEAEGEAGGPAGVAQAGSPMEASEEVNPLLAMMAGKTETLLGPFGHVAARLELIKGGTRHRILFGRGE